MRVLLKLTLHCFAFLLGMLLSTASILYAQETPTSLCSSEELDLNIGLRGDSRTSAAHWLVIEIRNRGDSNCTLAPQGVGFPGDSHYTLGGRLAPDTSQAAATFDQRSQSLGPGDQVHILVAWTSTPPAVNGVAFDDCGMHDELSFYTDGRNPMPFLRVRGLSIWSCDAMWSSSYRYGPYVAAPPIAKEWLDRVHLRDSDFMAGDVRRISDSRIDTGSDDIKLWAFWDIQYLKGSPGSGYPGSFPLFLRTSTRVSPNCPFTSLRQREANGRTMVYLHRCEHPIKARNNNAQDVLLLIWDFGLLPDVAGVDEYDAFTDVMEGRKHVLERSRLILSVRDPDKTMLPVIDTNYSACRTSQLQLTSPIVDLGNHWSQPRGYPVRGDDWYDGRVFELTNISRQKCILGGMPEMKFLNPPEITSGSINPQVCRNCSTPLFKPRQPRWIDLQPGESAHFIVVRMISRVVASNWCNVIGGIEMTVSGDQSIRLPFEVSYCGAIAVSAWREGKYDGDPMNTESEIDRRESERTQKWIGAPHPSPSKVACVDNSKPVYELPPPGEECARQEYAKRGMPVMATSGRGIAFGISSEPGKPKVIHIWMDNQTDQPQTYYMCCVSSFLDAIDVYDSGGHRLLSNREQSIRKTCSAGPYVKSCTCSFVVSVAPHTLQVVDGGDLEPAYVLSPGRYFVVPAKVNREYCEVLEKITAEASTAEPSGAIMITVQE